MENQIEEWKAKHGEIFKITVDGKIAYLRKPNRKDLSYLSVVAKNDYIKANEILLNSCWLGGDEEIKTNDEFFLSAIAQLGNMIKVKGSELEKL
jgi:hypothetical protein